MSFLSLSLVDVYMIHISSPPSTFASEYFNGAILAFLSDSCKTWVNKTIDFVKEAPIHPANGGYNSIPFLHARTIPESALHQILLYLLRIQLDIYLFRFRVNLINNIKCWFGNIFTGVSEENSFAGKGEENSAAKMVLDKCENISSGRRVFSVCIRVIGLPQYGLKSWVQFSIWNAASFFRIYISDARFTE